MRPTLVAICISVTGMLLVACGHDHPVSHNHNGDDQNTSSTTPEKMLEGMSLNDGQKWRMDDHTRASLTKMASSFLNADHQAMEEAALRQAGVDLKTDIDTLIKGCTMTGEAHDQLHVYLTGYIPAVIALKESGSMEDVVKVKHYLENYNTYFE